MNRDDDDVIGESESDRASSATGNETDASGSGGQNRPASPSPDDARKKQKRTPGADQDENLRETAGGRLVDDDPPL